MHVKKEAGAYGHVPAFFLYKKGVIFIIKHLPVRMKINILVIGALIALIGTNMIGYHYMNEMARQSETMYEEKLSAVQLLGLIRTENRAIDARILEMIVTEDKEVRREIGDKLESDMNGMVQLLSGYEENRHIDEEETSLFKQLKNQTSEYLSAMTSVQDLALSGQTDAAYKLYMNRSVPPRNNMIASADELTVYHENGTEQLYNESQQHVETARTMMIGLSVLSMVVFLLVSVVISRSITHPIREVKSLLTKAEHGDLRAAGTYQSRDELGQLTRSFNEMTGEIRRVVEKVDETAEQAALSSVELTRYAEETMETANNIKVVTGEVAEGAETQLVELTETVVTMNQLSETVRHIAENAQSASSSALHVSEKASSGQLSVEEAVHQMSTIHTHFAQLEERIDGLGYRSTEISQIVDTITEIADQTNLLALNAAIEAARAGEHGRGFSVVAEEVRRLAEQSAMSAKKITTLISSVQSETDSAMNTMDEASGEVTKGLDIVRSAGESFSHIYTSTNIVTAQIQEVSAAVQQIAAGTEQLVSNASNIQRLAEKTALHTDAAAASTEQQAEAIARIVQSAGNLSDVSVLLKNTIGRFQFGHYEQRENNQSVALVESDTADEAVGDGGEPAVETVQQNAG